MQGREASDERAAKHLDRIGEQVALANRIVTDLLDMIRDRPLKREPLRLDEVWKDALTSVHAPEGVSIHAEGLEALPTLQGDPGQMRQVFVNLLENAVQAVGETGTVVPIPTLVSLLSEARRDGLVALVEDDLALSDNLTEVLRVRGFSCITARSVLDTNQLASVRPFAALVDLRLPGGPDGEALRRLRARFPELPARSGPPCGPPRR